MFVRSGIPPPWGTFIYNTVTDRDHEGFFLYKKKKEKAAFLKCLSCFISGSSVYWVEMLCSSSVIFVKNRWKNEPQPLSEAIKCNHQISMVVNLRDNVKLSLTKSRKWITNNNVAAVLVLLFYYFFWYFLLESFKINMPCSLQ